MGTYSGPAVVIDHEGNEHDVRAMLTSVTKMHEAGDQRIEGLTSWSGTLSGAGPWWELHEAGAPMTIRVRDREGTAYVKQFDAANALGPVRVEGSGPAPFD